MASCGGNLAWRTATQKAAATAVGWRTALDAATDAVDRTAEANLIRRLAREGLADELRTELQQLDAPVLSINLLDDSGYAAIHWATMKGHADCVRLLIAHGADIEERWSRTDRRRTGRRWTDGMVRTSSARTEKSAARQW